MNRSLAPWIETALALIAVSGATIAFLPVLGLASSALLFLLPVLLGAARGGVGPGLFAALAGSAAYNFFLLEPRFTLQVHQIDNFVSVVVLVLVALTTSRLAARLKQREADAQARAALSAEAAEISQLLAGDPPHAALDKAAALIEARYGRVQLPGGDDERGDPARFSPLDLAAAAWAAHNGDMTGHGTEIMPAADWTFLPLAPRNRRDSGAMALARPMNGATRSFGELDHLRQLGLLLGQGIDRVTLDSERRERERLEQRDTLRRTFLASLAHDFRTPLTVIAGRLSELAIAHPEAGDALAAAQRLDRMMNDLIGAARLEGGALAPHLEPVDLIDVVGSACDDLPLPAHLTLERAVAADLPFVTADPVLLRHILANLIDNACRHAVRTVSVSAHSADRSVVLAVSDDGPGVPDAEQAVIFDRFARSEGSDRADGSGLGLAIVKGFADAMGIAVALANAGPQGGACFTLTIPVATA